MNAAIFCRRRSRIDHEHHSHGKRRDKQMAHLVRDAGAVLVVMERKIVGYRLPNGEIVCVKARFTSEERANDVMTGIQVRNVTGERVPVRAYYCSRCMGWHLTSQHRITL